MSALLRLRQPLASSSRLFVRAQSTSTADLAASLPPPLQRPRYIVERTASGELPVYTDIKNGGSQVRTLVRKVQGDVSALRSDLESYLADGHVDPLRAPPTVVLRHTSRQVEIRGRWVEEIKGWLESRGF